MKKLSMFMVVGMGLYGSLLIACGDDDDVEVPCADDAECAAKCTEGDAATCVDGICDGCTLPAVDCTVEGTECADGCEEGAEATCNEETLTCDGCTPLGGADDDDTAADDDAAGAACTDDAGCEEGEVCTIAEGATEGTCGAAPAEDCSTLEAGAACGDGAGECKDGKCMASATADVTLDKFDGATQKGTCLTWADGAPGTADYKYADGKMDNADCIAGIANDLWWAGAAGADLTIDGKAIDQSDAKLTEAVTDGDHTFAWGGAEYPVTVAGTKLTFTTWTEVAAPAAEEPAAE